MSVKLAQTSALLAAAITTGLMAGLFAGFAYSVMPALGHSSSRTLIEAMQNINRAIMNGWFMIPFIGSIVLIVLTAVLAWRGYGRAALPWIVAGLVLYLVALFITSGIHVPLNNQLDKAGDPAEITNLAAVRHSFENKWASWNIIRALVHTAAFGCIALALVVYGAHADQARPAGKPPAAAGAGPRYQSSPAVTDKQPAPSPHPSGSSSATW